MKSLIIFVPEKFYTEKPGCMYGNVLHDTNEETTKFYILGLTESVQNITKSGHNLVPLGYFYGTENKSEYWEKKLPNWVELFLMPQNNSNHEFGVRNIILKNQKLTTVNCQTVIILYNEDCLLKAELYTDRIPKDQFSELRVILDKEYARKKKEELQNAYLAQVKETVFNILVLSFFYPVRWLCKAITAVSPILKYSSLGLHLHAWFKNAEWTLTILLHTNRFTLKTTNYIIAIIIDMLLGHIFLKLLLHFLEDSSPSEVLLIYAENVVESLKGLMNWLMGSPAGLKLNRSFNNILGKFFLYHIHLWWAFLEVSKPIMELAFGVLLFLGRLGVTFQISILSDLLSLVSFHTYCIYVYAARLFNIQVRGLTALFRLFLGKKKNPLRKRVDSCRYQPDQLFVGTLLFTILLFLMPTTWVYYIVFTALRLIMIGLGGLVTRLKFYLQIMPVYAFLRWLFQTVDATGSIGIMLLKRQTKGPVMLKTKAIIAPWSQTWKKTIPDTISIHPPIEWNAIVNSIFWGHLLYSF